VNKLAILLSVTLVFHAQGQTIHATLLKSDTFIIQKGQTVKVKSPDPRSDEVVYVQPKEGIVLAGYITLLPGEAYSPGRDLALSVSRFDERGRDVAQESATVLVQYFRDTIDE
jgi:hypothetical protein